MANSGWRRSTEMANTDFSARTSRLAILAVLMFLGIVAAACGTTVDRDPEVIVPNGDAQQGQLLLYEYGCQSCHTIPGVREARATVGPSLEDWADRHYIAGLLPNNPKNLIEWIRFPQSIEPGTVMPDMGVTEQDARDMAAYLYTLQRRTRMQPVMGGQ